MAGVKFGVKYNGNESVAEFRKYSGSYNCIESKAHAKSDVSSNSEQNSSMELPKNVLRANDEVGAESKAMIQFCTKAPTVNHDVVK